MTFTEGVELVGKVVEVLGVAVTVFGVVVALALLAYRLGTGHPFDDGYTAARRDIGRTVLLGLEILVAGDIIRTVAVDPSLTSVGVLAGIVAIRTFLSFAIEAEISGTLPGRRGAVRSDQG